MRVVARKKEGEMLETSTVIKISSILPEFVRSVSTRNYDNALGLLREIKALLSLYKAQYGMKHSKLDRVVEDIEALLSSKRNCDEEVQEMLNMMADMDIPIP